MIQYFNNESGKLYNPHPKVKSLFERYKPFFVVIYSGLGKGKTTTLSVLAIDRALKGMSGCFVSTNLQKSWHQFRQWVPWESVAENRRHMENPLWSNCKSVFELRFKNDAHILFTEFSDKDNDLWFTKFAIVRVNFMVMDDLYNTHPYQSEDAFNYCIGAVKSVGPNNEQPQVIVATSPPPQHYHWVNRYFGTEEPEDEYVKYFVRANLERIQLK